MERCLMVKHHHWRVVVETSGEHIVSIEPEMLAGREPSEADIEAIRTAAHHLLGFIGDPAPAQNSLPRWLLIAQADRTITNVEDFSEVGIMLRTSDRYWVRDEDGRVFEACWSEGEDHSYWWDFEGESPVDPVEFMPHPLDPRFTNITSEERP
jgi:hypothetical protein